jgi:hypothetical protein
VARAAREPTGRTRGPTGSRFATGCPQDFGATDEISEPEPSVVHLGVGSMDPQSDETYFEPTVEVQAEQS